MKPTIFERLKYLSFWGIVATVIGFGIAQAQRNSLIVTNGNCKQVITYRESHALVIWAGNYQHWNNLNNVENEARDVKKALEKQGFRVTVVGNPNGNKLRNSIKEFIDNYGYVEDNRLVIFFAGHGHTLQTTEGYLVPIDAPDPIIDEQEFWKVSLSMQDMMTFAKRIKAKHALFVFDSCFSGTIFKQRSSSSVTDAYIRDVMNKPVRQFLTAGDADEKVPAKSVFTPLFIRALEGEADLWKDGYVTGSELGLFMRQNLAEYTRTQTPQFGTINDPDLDRGDIVFQASNSTIVSPPPPPVPQPPTDASSHSSIRYSRLKTLLEQKNWREANFETELLMLEVASRTTEGWLRLEDIKNFSCQELERINSLWATYSGNRFGYGVQKEIWLEVGGVFTNYAFNEEIEQKLGESIGWRVNNRWLPYSEIEYSLEAKRGHLPTQTWWSPDWKKNNIQGGAGSSLAQKIQACES